MGPDSTAIRTPMHLLVTGVASSGKTSVARLLAVRLGAEYLEADAFHSPANVEKMTAGIPLTDADREPWLRAIGDAIAKHHAAGTSTVVACSALRRYYRDILRAPLPAGAAYVVQLRAPFEVLAARIAQRTDHFMPPSLLSSQFDILEPLAEDEDGVVVDVGPPLPEVAESAAAAARDYYSHRRDEPSDRRTTDLLRRLEAYYDAAPRCAARAEQVGPFTLFVKTDPAGWDYYARPRLDLDVPFTALDVEAVRDRQRELGLSQSIEWVAENTPSLAAAARADGMPVQECPLLVLPPNPSVPGAFLLDAGEAAANPRVASVAYDSPDLADVVGVVDAAFEGTDHWSPGDPGPAMELLRDGLLVMVAAFDDTGALVGGGCHSPRGKTTELTGVAVLPLAREHGVGAALTRALVDDAISRGIETIFLSAQDDAVARIYERIGFVRVGTACIAQIQPE